MRIRASAFVAPILALGMAVGCLPKESDWSRLEPPVQATDFTLPRLDGGSVSLSDYQGRIVIMEFWATWCPPCRFSTPSLDMVYRNFRDQGVVVLLINQGEDPDTVRDWIAGRFEATVLLDRDGAVGARYGASGLPQLILVDQSGQILYVRSGYGGGLEHNLKLILGELLAQGEG